MSFPSLALRLKNMDDSFIEEFVLWNANIDFLRYIDYRKSILIQSYTIFILHNKEYKN